MPRPFYVTDRFTPLKLTDGYGMPSGNAQGPRDLAPDSRQERSAVDLGTEVAGTSPPSWAGHGLTGIDVEQIP
jgi:hypothetical protein